MRSARRLTRTGRSTRLRLPLAVCVCVVYACVPKLTVRWLVHTGVYEALELRDKDESVHMGKGVTKVGVYMWRVPHHCVCRRCSWNGVFHCARPHAT